MLVIFLILCFCEINSPAYGVKLPASITRCRRSDPKFTECLKNGVATVTDLFKNGNKALGLQKLDPFYVPKISVDDSGTSQQVQLNQNYENLHLYGFTNAIVTDLNAEFSSEKCFWEMKALTPKVRMEADYSLTGRMMVFPLNGYGKCVIHFDNVRVHHHFECEKYEKNGKSYFKVKEYKLDQQPEKIHYHFEDIIPGNPQLSQEVENVMNENDLDIYSTVKNGFDKSYALIYANVINSFFSKVPEDELFLD